MAQTDTELDGEFERAVAAIQDRRRAEDASRAMWRTHHPPHEYDRCVVVAGRHWCRRCLTLYPLAFLFAGLTLAGWSLWPERLDLWFIWLPCIPATIDFVLEQLQAVRYSARRQFATTLLVAPALGRGLGHELADSFSWEMWGPVLCFCTIWFFAAIEGHRRRGGFAR
ncbi:MAG: hypothetical protein R2695_13305 [Acidimicrobiales bacterium]